MKMDKKQQKQAIIIAGTVAIIGAAGFFANNLYSQLQEKMEKSTATLASIEQALQTKDLILEKTKQSSLQQTAGSLVIKEKQTNQLVMTLDYTIDHPFSSWFSNEKNIPFKIKSTIPILARDLKLESGTFDFQGNGIFFDNGNVEIDIASLTPVQFKNKQSSCDKPKSDKPKTRTSDKTVSLGEQKIKIKFLKNENKSTLSYNIDSFKVLSETLPTDNFELKSFAIDVSSNSLDKFDGALNISAKQALFPSSKMQANDLNFKIATEKDKKNNKYDFIIGGGIKKISVASYDNIGMQLQYSLRGISKKVLQEFVEIEQVYRSELAKTKECAELSDSSKALIEAKTNAVIQTVANDMLLSGFTSNIDTLRLANSKNYIDAALQLKMEGVPSKELISFEDSLKLFFILQLKGEVAQMVAPFLEKGKSMGFDIAPQIENNSDTTIAQINIKLSYDKNGLVINESPAPKEISFMIKKGLRDLDRSAKLQNRPELVPELPTISENEGSIVEPPQPEKIEPIPAPASTK